MSLIVSGPGTVILTGLSVAEAAVEAQVGVIGVPHERWGETPLAVVVLKDGQTATEADLIAYARADLAHYKCPTRVVFAESLPRNASGKLLKPEMRRIYGGGR